MAGPDLTELHDLLADPVRFAQDPFTVLRDVGRAYQLAEAYAATGDDESLREARGLVIRAVERRDDMGPARALHDALLRRIGLFPYLDEEDLHGTDLLAYEAHRPLGSAGNEMVWHRAQAEVYAQLMDGRNVILSAPTSFGKSLVIDGLVMSGRYRNIVIIVPTIALIDEARRRLMRLGGGHKVVSHVGQATAERNILVLTQERLLEFEELPKPDLFVIDEFYKLSIEDDADRARLLNQAFYRLLQTRAQFYLLGPNVGGIAKEALARLDCIYIDSYDTTVAVDVLQVRPKGTQRHRLLELCRSLDEPTLVFCSGPARAETVASWLAESGLTSPGDDAAGAARWLRKHYHPSWRVADALDAGIGVHHGRLPRSLAHFMVQAFDDEEIRFLVCTSTLIEGVNTRAKNIIVVDQVRGQPKRAIDLFTYNNIKGRSGRMGSHVVGQVFLFRDPPDEPLKPVEIPILTQGDDASPDLLLGVDVEDLLPTARERLDEVLDDAMVSREVLEASPAVTIRDQLALADGIRAMPDHEAVQLSWSGPYPRRAHLEAVFGLVWRQVFGADRYRFGVGSPGSLAVWLNRAGEGGDTRTVIEAQHAFQSSTKIETIILNVLQFQRQGLTYEIPKWLMAVDRLQRALLPRKGVQAGDYSAYAARVENLFMPAPLGALDEYGVPPELARKLASGLIRGEDDLDRVLGRLARLDGERFSLDDFERRLLRFAQADLVAAVG